MKNYQQFLKETYKQLGAGSESSVKILDVENPKLIIKKSHKGEYSDLMNTVHEMMSKRPDLFCKIVKHNKDYVIAEKLDIDTFEDFVPLKNKELLKKAEKAETSEYYERLQEIFYDSLDDKHRCKKAENFIVQNKKLFDKEDKFVKDYINIRIEIFDYFKDFINIKKRILCDFSDCNFGFKKGTQEIRCLDPIFIDK